MLSFEPHGTTTSPTATVKINHHVIRFCSFRRVAGLAPLPNTRSGDGRLGRFKDKIVLASRCSISDADMTGSRICLEAAQLNCELPAVQAWSAMIASCLHMQALKVKPQRAVGKLTPQTTHLPFET